MNFIRTDMMYHVVLCSYPYGHDISCPYHTLFLLLNKYGYVIQHIFIIITDFLRTTGQYSKYICTFSLKFRIGASLKVSSSKQLKIYLFRDENNFTRRGIFVQNNFTKENIIDLCYFNLQVKLIYKLLLKVFSEINIFILSQIIVAS